MRGKITMDCPHCGRKFVLVDESEWTGACSMCGKAIASWTCGRCDYTWVPRDPRHLVKVCPKCSSPYWCRERVRKDYVERGLTARSRARRAIMKETDGKI